MPSNPRDTTPETLPAGTRRQPPVLPPAPPGGGSAGPPGGGPFRQGQGGGAPGAGDLMAALLPLLNDLSVARVTFETLDCYPDDPSLRSELMSIVEEARDNLLRQLDSLLERLATGEPPFTDDALRNLQFSLLSAPSSFGTFSLILIRSRETLRAMPPREFALLVLEHFQDAVRDDARYHCRDAFNAEVYNDFQALLFAAQLASAEG